VAQADRLGHQWPSNDLISALRTDYLTRREAMTKKFDPAPTDKLAVDPKKAVEADLKFTKLEEGLEATFPASDAVSEIQPKPSKY
jgi:hypothetical protein